MYQLLARRYKPQILHSQTKELAANRSEMSTELKSCVDMSTIGDCTLTSRASQSILTGETNTDVNIESETGLHCLQIDDTTVNIMTTVDDSVDMSSLPVENTSASMSTVAPGSAVGVTSYNNIVNTLTVADNVNLPTAVAVAHEVVDTARILQKKVEKKMISMAKSVNEAFLQGTDILQLLKLVEDGITYGDEKRTNLTSAARQAKAELHQIRSTCFLFQNEVLKAACEMDKAIVTVQRPTEPLIQLSRQTCLTLCQWFKNLNFVEQSVISYLRAKHRAAVQLSKELAKELVPAGTDTTVQLRTGTRVPAGTDGALMLITECCIIGRTLWTAGTRLLTTDYLIELLVLHAELSADSGLWDVAQTDIADAFGFGGSDSVELYQMAVRINMNKLTTRNKMPESLKMKLCDETLEYLDKTQQLKPQDKDLLSLQSTVREIKSDVSTAEDKKSWTEETEDWCLDMVNIINKQQEQQRAVADKFRANQVSKIKNKARMKEVRRKGTEPEETMMSSCTAVRSSFASVEEILLQMSVGKEPNMSSQTGKQRRSNKKQCQPVMSYVRNNVTSGNQGRKKVSSHKKECKASRDVYSFLVGSYNVHLGCVYCIETPDIDSVSFDDYFVRVRQDKLHRCVEDCLLVQEKHSNRIGEWTQIRPCPRSFRPESGICESFIAGELCHERTRCPFPHSDAEKQLWTRYFSQLSPGGTSGAFTVQRFVTDLRESSLRIKFEMERLVQVPGALRLLCQECRKNGKIVGKKHHLPVCDGNGHVWDNNHVMLFVRESGEVIGRSSGGVATDVWSCVDVMKALGLTDSEVVEEYKQWKQQNKSIKAASEEQKQTQLQVDFGLEVTRDRVSISSSGFDSGITTVDDDGFDGQIQEEPEGIYDEGDTDDVMMACGDVELEESDDEMYAEDAYYELKPSSTLRDLIVQQPLKYKRCTIHLDGPFNARCRMLDEGFQVERVAVNGSSNVAVSLDEESDMIHEVEVRGRANCGPCFDGDEVVVELRKTKELDGDRIIYRGTVVGILAKKIVRKTHTFLCRVDSYVAHLMKPLDGVAPKIHAVHSIINKRFKERSDELVAVYSMVDGELKLRKIVKLDPKKRRDMLFVVKYLQWVPGAHNMYPLGYVTKVIRAGEKFEDSQSIINILCQIPTRPSVKCAEAAELIYNDSEVDDGVEDIRSQLTLTIDPIGCHDVDDAITLRKLPTGEFVVGVHIADVSKCIEQDDVIDADAFRRVTSFYSATHKVYHMLPSRLSEDLCSLREGADRPVLSVYILVNKDLNHFKLYPQKGIRRSLMRNDKQLTYEEAQEMISEARGRAVAWDPTSLPSVVNCLHRIAQQMRMQRLRAAKNFYSESEDPFCITECHEAHQLIEEFMIRANAEVAEFLVERFPETLPVRRQKAPDDDTITTWSRIHGNTAAYSLYFRQFELLHKTFSQVESSATGEISFLSSTVEELEKAAHSGNIERIKQLIGTESHHPLHALAMHNWFKIQESAEYVCHGDLKDVSYDASHFSLCLSHYVQFTSPIRRFIDIVIHRFIVAALDQDESPYSLLQVREICKHVNHVNHLSKKYSNLCQLLTITNKYLTTPFYLPCVIEDFGEDEVVLDPLYLTHLKRSQRSLKYSHLSLCDKPEIAKDKSSVRVHWDRRLYDAQLNGAARSKYEVRNSRRLDTHRHTMSLDCEGWGEVLRNLVVCDWPGLVNNVQQVAETMHQSRQFRTGHLEITSEMRNDEPIVRHHAQFNATFQRGSVVVVQFGAKCSDGYLQPVPRLMNLTHQQDLCIEHRTDGITCFAELATEKVRESYESVEHYQRVWLPILAMEAVTKTTMSGESIVCNNVPVSLVQRNNKYYGKLHLSLLFCKKRNIKIFNNSKDAEEETSDYMCIRCHTQQDTVCKSKDVQCVSAVRNVWIGHAVAQYAHVNENKDVCVEFVIQHCNVSPPTNFLSAGKKKSAMKCTIEFLTKLLPDRRMEDAVKNIQNSSDLCKGIILGHNVEALPGTEDIESPLSDTFDIDVDADIMLNRNNPSQTAAIRAALRQRLTLIQGPPGTGKTLTGIKLVYWYVHMNKKIAAERAGHRQILYCGPSNSAVDVAAKLLKTRLGSKCPRLIRVYSEMLENQVFPLPRDSMQSVGSNQGRRRYELIDKDEHHDIALHHLIRRKGNKFSQRIRQFDRLFRDNIDTPENVSDEKVEEYQKLIGDAAVHELQSYDVILCTCAASASPRMTRGANVVQIIIDECGMCMEPECVVPLAAFKSAQQVVLIGDHKQLQPIVVDSVAKNLGLNISLFERYHNKAIMLTHQYRMHPAICEFPSQEFYDGELQTADNHECRGIKPPDCWPKQYGPVIFCHVEGAEKSLAVSTADGNEQSKSNDAEKEEAVRVFLRLVNYYDTKLLPHKTNVNANNITILSQYRAQCSAIEQDLTSKGFQHPNVSTVIASQGDEWDFVILSLARSMPEYEIEKCPSIGWCKRNMGFITDEHQINVALTRARLGLIIIGNKHLLRCSPMWNNLLNHCRNRRCVVNANQFLRLRGDRVVQRGPETALFPHQQQQRRRQQQQAGSYQRLQLGGQQQQPLRYSQQQQNGRRATRQQQC